MTTKSISQLETQAVPHVTDLFEVASVDANSASGYKSGKMSAEVIAEGILNTYTYPIAMPNLQNRTITGAINTLLGNFAPIYDATATYREGDVVTYNGQLYKANQDIETPEAFDVTKWDAGTAADFFEGGGEQGILVTAMTSYDNYGLSTADKDTRVSLYLRSGDIVIFVISHRSALILPTGVTLIHTSDDAIAADQRLTFARYDALSDEMKLFEFITESNGRIFLETFVFRNVQINYTGNYYVVETSAVLTITAPVKPSGAILLWGFAHPTMNNTGGGLQTTPSDIIQVSWRDNSGSSGTVDSSKAPRSAAFYDDGSGANNRTFGAFGNSSETASTMIIDALEITPM